jgi:dihydroneopterin triphosphate diphosphatase
MRVRPEMITVYVVRPDDSGSHEFLQLRRRENDYLGGTWQAISGGIEPEEIAWQAALREVKEEAGLTPLQFYRLGVVNPFYIAAHDTLWISISFCAIVGREATVTLNDEHTDFRWVRRDEIDANFMWPTDRLAVRELCRDILDDGAAKPFLRIPLNGEKWRDDWQAQPPAAR